MSRTWIVITVAAVTVLIGAADEAWAGGIFSPPWNDNPPTFAPGDSVDVRFGLSNGGLGAEDMWATVSWWRGGDISYFENDPTAETLQYFMVAGTTQGVPVIAEVPLTGFEPMYEIGISVLWTPVKPLQGPGIVFNTGQRSYARFLVEGEDLGAPVPEPATLALMGLGLAGVAAVRRRKARRAA